MTETRTCHRCGIEYPLNDFYHTGNPIPGKPRYRRNDCRYCVAASYRRTRALRKQPFDLRRVA